ASQRPLEDARRYLEGQYPEQKSRPAEVWVALAALEERQGQPEKALACLDDAQRLGGDRVELRLARAGHLVRNGEGKGNDALLALADGTDRFSDADRRRLFRGLATAYTQAKMTAEAGHLWQRLAKKWPDDLQSRLVLFDLSAQARDVAAMDQLQEEISRIGGPDGVMWRQARISALLAEVERDPARSSALLPKARSLLAEMAARQPDSPRVPLNGARINDMDKRPDDALPLY